MTTATIMRICVMVSIVVLASGFFIWKEEPKKIIAHTVYVVAINVLMAMGLYLF